MDSDQFAARFNEALNRPIQTRCAELTVLFDRANIKDLQYYYPILIDHIFGPQTGISWELRSTTVNSNCQDFHALQHFLSPTGPIFKLITTLLRDPFIKYEYSLIFVPLKIRQLLDIQCAHPFYTELAYVNNQTKQINSLLLNPFDYYMFHFAYHLINPWHQKNTNMTVWNTVYYMLCCDYVLHFLPTNPSYLVLPNVNFYTGKTPSHIFQSVTKPTRSPKLLRSTIFQEQLNEFSTSIHQPLERHPRNETWRSETVLTVFIDMWLGNDQLNNKIEEFNVTTQRNLHFNELPTGEYIRIIRVLVKRIHAFSSSVKIDDTYMAELKRIALPMLQGKIYVFLRNLVHRWPLDGSFRLVLELWLSFIQPWRYSGNQLVKDNNLQTNSEGDEINSALQTVIDREYLPFIAENFLAYIIIFQQLLPRFSRVDLASPKNSLMLYRLTKVFNQPNLVPLLREIEHTIENKNPSPIHSFNTSWPSNMPPLSPTTSWSSNTYYNMPSSQNGLNNSFLTNNSYRLSGKYTAIVRQKMQELEGLNFYYKPLFTAGVAPEVYELIRHIKRAEVLSQEIIHTRVAEIERASSGISGFFKSLFGLLENSNDEFTLEERNKVPGYLNLSLQHIYNIFNISEHDVEEHSYDPQIASQSQAADSIQTLLTPTKVRERIKSIRYDGDPDLHPIRSNENKFLVRTLYQLSCRINEQYGATFCRLYSNNNIVGRIAKQILSPPTVVYKFEKTNMGRSPKVPVHLPPRISLRYFAGYKFLSLATICFAICKLSGYHAIIFVFLAILFYFAYLFINVLLKSPNDANDIYNLSLNESF